MNKGATAGRGVDSVGSRGDDDDYSGRLVLKLIVVVVVVMVVMMLQVVDCLHR